MNGGIHNARSLQARILSGSAVLLSGSGLTTAVNLAYNILVAQFLGPKGFGHATVVYTLLTVLSGITLSFQIISTKLVAQQASPEAMSAVYRWFHGAAWACGLFIAALLLIFRVGISSYLNLPDPLLVALLALGAAFYIPLGSRRGFIQGTYGFRSLATNLVLEGIVRLCGSFLLILAGFGVRGVIAANAAAIAVAYFAAAPKLAQRIPNPISTSFAIRETCYALVFFSGQVLINNSDIVLVKHFFPAKLAGIYAAIAMVGRVIFSFSSAVVNTTFPLVAGTRDEERKDLRVIATALLLVFGIGSILAFGLCITPAWMWTALFGSGFEIAGGNSLPGLLALYALTTVIYSLSVVIITFEMSYKIANTSWVQLAFSGVLIAGICRFHSSLQEVILVQLYLMALLFAFIAIPFLIHSLTNPKDLLTTGGSCPIRLVRRVAENEVVAEFLKSDFSNPAFENYQETMRDMVAHPNLNDPTENAKRRALLFLRHLALWKELPDDTQWYQVEISEPDLKHIRVFPRAHWRKMARGSFSITEVAEYLHVHRDVFESRFLTKIRSISDQLCHEEPEFGAVILIGIDEDRPLAILDGNHRLVAAMLSNPHQLRKLTFICGLSEKMTECCWYNTNLFTLFRYAANVMAQTVRNPEAELERILQSVG